jgi:hypothetical protein
MDRCSALRPEDNRQGYLTVKNLFKAAGIFPAAIF